jgi:hypothetical protein
MDDFEDIENRERLPAIPHDLQGRLNEIQYLAVRRIEDFGWDLKFVRRENLKAPVVVVASQAGGQFGVLEADGRLNLQHGLKIRR